MNTVYPIGTEQDPSGQKTRDLMADQNMHMVDCRINPWSWRECWQKPTLVRLYGKRYHPAGRFLGNAKHPSNQMFPDKCEVELVDPETGIRGLCTYLDEGQDLILLDGFLELQYSHVDEILRRLLERRPGVEIRLPDLASKQQLFPPFFPTGAKVYAHLGGKAIPAIVLESWPGEAGTHDWCDLRIAAWSPLEQRWLISRYRQSIQSHKLKRRYNHIAPLDGPLRLEENDE